MMDYLLITGKNPPMQSTFKFHKLFAEGFVANGFDVISLSTIPVTQSSHKKRVWSKKNEFEGGILYHYPTFINLVIIKHIMVFIYTFFYILPFAFFKRNKIFLCINSLDYSMAAGALCASKLVKIKSIGIVTDLPHLIQRTLNVSKLSFLEKNSNNLFNLTINWFDALVLLTSQMNKVINKKARPYCIIEGLVDINLKYTRTHRRKEYPRIIMYSGGLFETYGIKLLLDAFTNLPFKDIQLSIYGKGDMEKEIIDYCKKDNRILYHGLVSNEKIVEEQQYATLLVNPRPSKEEFTEYSFPSKNIEYMASGTPVLTTRLRGIPKEYEENVFMFDQETIEGFEKTLRHILSLPANILARKGQRAREFVLNHKNNKTQVEKVINLIKGI